MDNCSHNYEFLFKGKLPIYRLPIDNYFEGNYFEGNYFKGNYFEGNRSQSSRFDERSLQTVVLSNLANGNYSERLGGCSALGD